MPLNLKKNLNPDLHCKINAGSNALMRIHHNPITVRVADPHSFHMNPDPVFWAEYQSGSNPDSGL
jgi:hypothetical protein